MSCFVCVCVCVLASVQYMNRSMARHQQTDNPTKQPTASTRHLCASLCCYVWRRVHLHTQEKTRTRLKCCPSVQPPSAAAQHATHTHTGKCAVDARVCGCLVLFSHRARALVCCLWWFNAAAPVAAAAAVVAVLLCPYVVRQLTLGNIVQLS